MIWFYRRMLRIAWTANASNEKVFKKTVTRGTFILKLRKILHEERHSQDIFKVGGGRRKQ